MRSLLCGELWSRTFYDQSIILIYFFLSCWSIEECSKNNNNNNFLGFFLHLSVTAYAVWLVGLDCVWILSLSRILLNSGLHWSLWCERNNQLHTLISPSAWLVIVWRLVDEICWVLVEISGCIFHFDRLERKRIIRLSNHLRVYDELVMPW